MTAEIKQITKPSASLTMLAVADDLRQFADAMERGEIAAAMLVMVERGPDRNIIRIKAVDEGWCTLVGALELAKFDIIEEAV